MNHGTMRHFANFYNPNLFVAEFEKQSLSTPIIPMFHISSHHIFVSPVKDTAIKGPQELVAKLQQNEYCYFSSYDFEELMQFGKPSALEAGIFALFPS